MDRIEDVVKLQQFGKLKTLIVSNNPFLEKFQGNSFDYLVIQFKRIQRLNKVVLNNKVRIDAIKYEKKLFQKKLTNSKNDVEEKE